MKLIDRLDPRETIRGTLIVSALGISMILLPGVAWVVLLWLLGAT